MRWIRVSILCCGSLVLFICAGCAKIARFDVNPKTLETVGHVSPGMTLEWVAPAPGDSFSVQWEDGLCKEGTEKPLKSKDGIAKCTVGPLKKGVESAQYKYTLLNSKDGSPGPQYVVDVGPGGCKHCVYVQPTPVKPPPPQGPQ